MFICKNPGDNGDWSSDGCLIWCFWCMQCSNPNDFQMMEEMSCIHLPLPENLACMYQMLQSVERSDGNWQHIISFQWIWPAPSRSLLGFFHYLEILSFDFPALSSFKLSVPDLYLCAAQTGLWLISCSWRTAEWLSQTEKRSEMEEDSFVIQLPCHTCHMTEHDLINREES